MRKIVTLFALIFAFSTLPANAQSYTKEEVADHNTSKDCWMIFENGVYDFSLDHLENHEDKYMPIDEWCGKDMTQDFKTKASEGKDHKSFVYDDLENYKIGTIDSSTQDVAPLDEPSEKDESSTFSSPYNPWPPFLIASILYLSYWGITKTDFAKKYKLLSKNIFNFVSNSFLLMGLIPSAVFGFIMVSAYNYDQLRDIDFDFLYWHVELSVAFATLILCHFFTRFKLYLVPLKLFRRRPKVKTSM